MLTENFDDIQACMHEKNEYEFKKIVNEDVQD